MLSSVSKSCYPKVEINVDIVTDFTASYINITNPALVNGPLRVLSVNCWILLFVNAPGGTVSFNQNWATYRAGFGTPGLTNNYWIGNENMFLLTSSGSFKLRVEVRS